MAIILFYIPKQKNTWGCGQDRKNQGINKMITDEKSYFDIWVIGVQSVLIHNWLLGAQTC